VNVDIEGDHLIPIVYNRRLYIFWPHFEEKADKNQQRRRMKHEQTEILYLTGESRKVVENSPHLEAPTQKGYEVLYFNDPVDELMIQSLARISHTV
jgi:HSP90 family molecular chaperone